MAFEHLAVAVGYADAKGLPYETKSKQEIFELGGVEQGLLPPDAYAHEFEDFKGYPIGTWSDDTQHTLAMMKSILSEGSFDLTKLFSELLVEYELSSAGWGNASKKAMSSANILMSAEQLRNIGVKSSGCGPLMRLAPLAIYQTFHTPEHEADIDVMDATTLTHATNEAVAVSQALASTIRSLVRRESGDFMTTAIGNGIRYERMNHCDAIFSERLKRSVDSINIADAVYSTDIKTGKNDAFVIWSVAAVALSVFAKYHDIGFRSLIDTVIAEGGDTDSSAAIVAGLYLAKYPDFHLDDETIQQLDRKDDLLRTGNDFSSLVTIH